MALSKRGHMMKFILPFFITVLMASVVHAECTITFRQTEAFPFHFKNKQGQWSGIFTDQARAITREAGCTIKNRDIPWARALILMETGQLDMMGWMSITEERKKFLNFIGPHFFEVLKIVVREDSNYNITRHEDLFSLEKPIGLIRDAWYGEKLSLLLKKETNKRKIRWVSGSEEAFLMDSIRLNRLSAYVTAEVPGILASKLYDGLKFHRFVVNNDPVYFGLSKKTVSPSQFKKLQKAFDIVKNRGEIKEILTKYE